MDIDASEYDLIINDPKERDDNEESSWWTEWKVVKEKKEMKVRSIGRRL